MLLYLVDEYTSKPVYDPNGLYPKTIQINSKEMNDFLPVMRLGVQAISVVNGAAGLLSLFCPGVPSSLIPEGMAEKAKKFVDCLDREGSSVGDHEVVQNVVDGDGDGGAKRGSELRQFEKFINEFDPEANYSNLRKVCDKSNGNAIWVTNESAKKMEDEGGGDENERFKLENAKLNEALTALENENNALKKSGAESRSVSTPNKLRGEVEAMRE